MASPGRRQVRVSADHQSLAAEVLEISNRFAAVERHLSELRDLQARAIALAASRGVPQRVLAEIVGVTPPRISQIVQGQPVDIDREQLHERWLAWQDRAADQVRALSGGTADDLARVAGFQAYVHERQRVEPSSDA
ncbi:hypothetical protein ACVBEQ_27005 [Nakamurella sp. GG22]